MNKHTAGPWEYVVGADNTDGQDALGSIRDIKERWHIARIWDDAASEEEQTANAHLIAAAPELLEALEGLLKWIDFVADEHCGCSTSTEATYARAVWAKAKGE